MNGITNADVDSGYCSHTQRIAENSRSWWIVDFQQSYFLSFIRISNRNCKHYLQLNILCENSQLFYSFSFTLLYSRKCVLRDSQNEGLFSGS